MWKTRVTIVSALLLAMGIGALFAGPARAAFDAIQSCAQSTACLEWDNTKGGDAIKGVSSKGDALHGQTKFNSTGKTAGKAGVFGEDLSSSGTSNSGVLGASTNGAGVIGTSASYNAVEGLSVYSTGVYGQSSGSSGLGVAGRNVASTATGGAGVYADGGPANDGLQAFSTLKSGVYAFSQNGTALFGNDGSTDSASELVLQDSGHVLNDAIEVRGQSGDVFTLRNDGQANFSSRVNVGGEADFSGPTYLNGGDTFLSGETEITGGSGGLYVTSDSADAAVFRDNFGDPYNVLYLQSGNTGTNYPAFQVGNANNFGVMTVTDTGNLIISGYLYSQGSCHNGCIEGDKQVRNVATYAPTEAEPTIEDTGEATLVNGRADVALDPQFANVIDGEKGYVVLLTPEGDCRGLYVTQRSAAGFVVHELQGGRSSIGFAYRIVAKRYGVDAARLPMTVVKPIAVPRPRAPRHH